MNEELQLLSDWGFSQFTILNYQGSSQFNILPLLACYFEYFAWDDDEKAWENDEDLNWSSVIS